MSKMYIGVDFGTTNTIMASCKEGRRFNLPHIREIRQYVDKKTIGASKTLPSVLIQPERGELMVGEFAKRQKDIGHEHVLYLTKYDLGKDLKYKLDLTPQKVATEILKVCNTNVRNCYISKRDEFPKTIISVPATFNYKQRTELLNAAELAGFPSDKISLIPEPIAALVHYINTCKMGIDENMMDISNKTVLVCDIDDQDINISVVLVKSEPYYGKYFMTVESASRFQNSGGVLFDSDLAKLILKNIGIESNELDIEAKEELTRQILPYCQNYRKKYNHETFDSYLSKRQMISYSISLSNKEYKWNFDGGDYLKIAHNMALYTIVPKLNVAIAANPKIDVILFTGELGGNYSVIRSIQDNISIPWLSIEDSSEAVALGASLSPLILDNSCFEHTSSTVKTAIIAESSSGYDTSRKEEEEYHKIDKYLSACKESTNSINIDSSAIPKSSLSDRYIFISYAHRDSEIILPILQNISREGYKIWFDDHIAAASEWDNSIATHITQSSFMISFISRNYLVSDNCIDELTYARDNKKKQLLIYLDDVSLPEGLAMRLNRYQNLKYYLMRSDELFFDKLFSAEGINVCR